MVDPLPEFDDNYDHALLVGVCYWIAPTVEETLRTELRRLLDAASALPCPVIPGTDDKDDPTLQNVQDPEKHLTHIISWTSNLHLSFDLSSTNISLTTPAWVTRCWDTQSKLDASFFSANPSAIFSGLTMTSTELPGRDTEYVAEIITSLGGRYITSLTKHCTHLLALRPSGTKYDSAMEHGIALGMKVVLPTWITACFATRTLHDTQPFEWPEPALLSADAETIINGRWAQLQRNPEDSSTQLKPTIPTFTSYLLGNTPYRDTKALFEIASQNMGKPSALGTAVDRYLKSDREVAEQEGQGHSPIFEGQRIYLATSLQLNEATGKSLAARALAAGAVQVTYIPLHKAPRSSAEMDVSKRVFDLSWNTLLEDADYVVVPKRQGWEYWLAHAKGKTIGNLNWLLSCFAEDRLLSPMDQLMHYPVPPNPIAELKDARMTITNYTGSARELLRRMIELMGASVSGDMNKTTTHVIAASLAGRKVESAFSWGITVTNHIWLTECFARWHYVDTSLVPGSAFFSHGVDHLSHLGDRFLTREGIEQYHLLASVTQQRDQVMQDFDAQLKQAEGRRQALEKQRRPMEVDDDRAETAKGSNASSQSSEPAGKSSPKKSQHSSSPSKKITKSPKKRIQSDSSTDEEITIQAINSPVHSDASKKRKLDSRSQHTNGEGSQKKKSNIREDSTSVSSEDDLAIKDNRRPKATEKRASSKGRAQSISSDTITATTATADQTFIGTENGGRSRRKAADLADKRVHKAAEDILAHEREKKRKRPSDLPEIVAHEAEARSSSPALNKKQSRKPKRSNLDLDLSASELDKATSTEEEIEIKGFGAPPKKPKTKSGRQPSTLREQSDAGDVADIRVLFSNVSNSDELAARLLKARIPGVRVVSSASECTHLVSDKITRTEKFCCAIPHVKYVLPIEWILDTINGKSVANEDSYSLDNQDMLKKSGTTLKKVMRRAKEGKLFDGHTFFITNRCGKPVDILKRVVVANGGKAYTGSMDADNITPNFWLISSMEDKPTWKPFIKANPGIVVYEPDFILESAFTQQIDQSMNKLRVG